MSKKYLWLLCLGLLLILSCSNNDGEKLAADFNVQFNVSSQIDVSKGGECVFASESGEGPQSTDVFMLESESGISYICPFTDLSENSFTVRIPDDLESGSYTVFIKRENGRKKSFGKIYINIVDELDFTPDPDTTVYGVVSVDNKGMKGVVVSDGIEVAVTDENGIYQLKSDKKWKYVFISVPSGYEVPSEGVLPQFYRSLKGDANSAERADFTLTKVTGQDEYKLFILGDMHLANRTNDSNQFQDFTSDLNAYRNQRPGTKMYAIALGDMTWDLYWYSNNYALPEYVNTINSQVKDLQIFHTIGNHDYDYKTTSTFDAASKYVTYIGPTYYSFNIGQVHYIVLDDIDCDKYDGTTSRNYEKRVSSEQLNWLSKDLSYVDKTTPLVVVLHAPVFYPSESKEFEMDHDAENTSLLLSKLQGYKVHFITGHTHMNYNVVPQSSIVDGQDFYEHNTGAICASWWWSGYLTPGIHISLDGTPGGYGIWDISGTNLQWLYKATGWSEDYQFRSYDLNNVHFSMDDVPLMPSDVSASVKKQYTKYVDAYPENRNNEVLINIWNWNPYWTLTVTDEKGNKLTPVEVWAYDPLHIAALSVKRFNSSSLTSTPSFITEKFPHFFKVKVDDADTDLTIVVTDEFGHQWTENMERPKEFSVDSYMAK